MAEMADAAGVAENRQLRWNGFAGWKSRWRRWRMPPGRRRFVNYGKTDLPEGKAGWRQWRKPQSGRRRFVNYGETSLP